jgi:hypothetical protein
MPRVRFTVRRLMIAVAIFALVLGGLVARGRHLRHVGDEFERKGRKLYLEYRRGDWIEKSTVAENRWLAYYLRMRDKYRKAARRPWLRVDPVPPEVEPDLPEPQ